MASLSCTSTIPSSMRCSASNKHEDDVLYHDVFLCHSGAQKDFVHQLHVDLRRIHISSFFDKDNRSLPKGKHFPSRIFENIKNCKVAVLVLSDDFLTKTKWPMLELSKLIQAKKEENPDLNILPLFYMISHRTLYQKLDKGTEYIDAWERLEDTDDKIDCEEWCSALKFIRGYNGINRSDYVTDVDYREDIVNKIVQLLPSNLLFDDSHVQGKERLCSEVGQMFKKVKETEGVKVLGLYGIGGCGKTTICKCLCNFYAREFKGKVFHIEFGSEINVLQTQKRLLQVVGSHDESAALDLASNKDQGWPILRKCMKKHAVFLALDGLCDDISESIVDASSYLNMGYREGSMIVFTSRHTDIFKSGRLSQTEIPFVHVPRLVEDEAVDILLKDTLVDRKNLSSEQKERFSSFAKNCVYSDAYNPSALKKMGKDLCEMFGSDPTQWKEIPNLDGLHLLTEKFHSFYELMRWYHWIVLHNPGLYWGINLLYAKNFLKEFLGIHFVLVKALLTQLVHTLESEGLIPFVIDTLNKKECKEFLNRTEGKGFLTSVMKILNNECKGVLNRTQIEDFLAPWLRVLGSEGEQKKEEIGVNINCKYIRNDAAKYKQFINRAWALNCKKQ